MNVVLNGEEKEIQSGMTVEELLDQLKISKERVAIEINMNIIPKGGFAEVALKDGDKIEIVSFVGGG